jgi:hypothetical protein
MISLLNTDILRGFFSYITFTEYKILIQTCKYLYDFSKKNTITIDKTDFTVGFLRHFWKPLAHDSLHSQILFNKKATLHIDKYRGIPEFTFFSNKFFLNSFRNVEEIHFNAVIEVNSELSNTYSNEILIPGSSEQQSKMMQFFIFQIIYHCPKLKYLDISDNLLHSNHFTELKQLHIYCPNIQYFQLTGLYNFNNLCLAVLAENFINIKEFNIAYGSINNSMLSFFIQKNPNLEVLYLYGCQYLTDESLFQIATLKNLTTLNLDMCNKITDEGICYMIKQCTELTSLSLACTNITDNAIIEVTSYLQKIRYLNINYCYKAQFLSTAIKIQLQKKRCKLLCNKV